MTLLQIMLEDKPETVLLRTRDEAKITGALRAQGVSFQRWPLRVQVTAGLGSDVLLDSYRAEIDELRERQGLRLADIVRLHAEEGPEWEEKAAKARSTFLEEHRHAEDEVRFFAHGTGCFYLHLDGLVLAVVCEAGDLLSVPAGTRHWFDMGPRPEFAAIRFFAEEGGWIGDFTGDPIARHFPRLDALLADG
ncbi:cupin [Streptomyces sp. H10-C2]|uniref:1,2-dihydroxy-3-keto-5-methylthiopentene dioxygenase n=1 Tax=unclassified Streptomyces TaxID=2593676 RepID=UPI0024BA8D49|nr:MULTISPECIES: cupin [unclassified Streptomyces]MDJ0340917.1 cupin [Streptomyces sp. PH10-H1]MDJ0369851.1 cupin [Streptomyces sp. H10-C2]